MKKILMGLVGAVAIAAGAGYVFREPLWVAAQQVITADMFVSADTDEYDVGLPIGQTFPPIKALHQGRPITDVSQFIADKGMVFIANRSADWWPFCMAQFVQLQSNLVAFHEAGIEVVALTYDEPSLQQLFIDKNGIDAVLAKMRAAGEKI